MEIHTTHLEGISKKFKLRANLNIKKTIITLRLYRAGENSLSTNVVNRKVVNNIKIYMNDIKIN